MTVQLPVKQPYNYVSMFNMNPQETQQEVQQCCVHISWDML